MSPSPMSGASRLSRTACRSGTGPDSQSMPLWFLHSHVKARHSHPTADVQQCGAPQAAPHISRARPRPSLPFGFLGRRQVWQRGCAVPAPSGAPSGGCRPAPVAALSCLDRYTHGPFCVRRHVSALRVLRPHMRTSFGQHTRISFCVHRRVSVCRVLRAFIRIFLLDQCTYGSRYFRLAHTWISFRFHRHASSRTLLGAIFLPRCHSKTTFRLPRYNLDRQTSVNKQTH